MNVSKKYFSNVFRPNNFLHHYDAQSYLFGVFFQPPLTSVSEGASLGVLVLTRDHHIGVFLDAGKCVFHLSAGGTPEDTFSHLISGENY